MLLRSATPEDKSAIIELLKSSLGESTIPKSELLWNWKHEQNPFGTSFLLLAEENEKLIGVRAFMQWEWQWKGEIFKSLRAVDTATHPNHQGKGIFKKLTLHLAGLCKQKGVSFIFNTPNTQSKPGYLKMGWVEQGKLPIKFKLLTPFSMAYRRILKQPSSEVLEFDDSRGLPWEASKINLITGFPTQTDQIGSNLSPQYISWRYEKNPLYKYNYFTDESNFLVISRIKKHSFGLELRLVEFILLNAKHDFKRINKEMGVQVIKFCKKNKIDFISLSGLQYSLFKACFDWMGILPTRYVGPSITLKDLNMNDRFDHLLKINNWNYSLGDLELF
jgi:GNAT superfamily N-acetyltransferase